MEDEPAAEQWLRDRGELPEPAPAPLPATVTFTGGPTITVYRAAAHSPALPFSGGADCEEFSGCLEPGRPGIP